MAARIEIEAGRRESPWPDVLNDYGLNGLRAGGARWLACAEDVEHASRRCAAPGLLEPS